MGEDGRQSLFTTSAGVSERATSHRGKSRTGAKVFSKDCVRGTEVQVSALRNVRKTTVMSGNQEDRGRGQLDQVSPLDIDSFFPFMCVRVRRESVSTVSVLEGLRLHSARAPAGRASSLLATTVAQRCHSTRSATWLKKKNCFSETLPRRLKKKNGCRRGCMEVYLWNLLLPSARFLRTCRNLVESVNTTGGKTCLLAVLLFKSLFFFLLFYSSGFCVARLTKRGNLRQQKKAAEPGL